MAIIMQRLRSFKPQPNSLKTNVRAWMGLGLSFAQVGNWGHAENSFETVFELSPNNIGFLKKIVALAYKKDSHRVLHIYGTKLLVLSPKSTEVSHWLENRWLAKSNKTSVTFLDAENHSLLVEAIEKSGFRVRGLNVELVKPLTKANTLNKEAFEIYLSSAQPATVVIPSKHPAAKLLAECCQNLGIPRIQLGGGFLKGQGIEIADDNDVSQFQTSLYSLLSIQTDNVNPIQPLFQVNIDLQDPNMSPQKVAQIMAYQRVPTELLHLNFRNDTIFENFDRHDFDQVWFPFSCGFESDNTNVTCAYQLEVEPEDLFWADAILQLIKEQINPPTIEFHTCNIVARSTAPVCALIRGWGNIQKTIRCIHSLRKHYGPEKLRIIYVDNGSELSEYQQLQAQFDTVEFVRFSQNRGSCRGINAGMALGALEPHDYYLILDNDAWPPIEDAKWLDRWLEYFKKSNIGGAGATSYHVRGAQMIELTPETYMRAFSRENGTSGKRRGIGVPILITFAVIYTRKALEAVGWLVDERYEPGNCEDSDLALRIRDAGYDLVVAKSIWIHHDGHQTFNREWNVNSLTIENQVKLTDKFGWSRLQRLKFLTLTLDDE
jgi:GT2 family glycosyltransferase